VVEIFDGNSGNDPLGKPGAMKISGTTYSNWDPTDPDRENPYMGNIPMILGAYDREVERYSDFDITSGVVALDATGKEVTNYMKVDGEVDMDTCGIYKITYSITDETGITGAATANIIVKDEAPPVLYANQVVDSIGVYDVTNTEELRELLLKNVVARIRPYDVVENVNLLVDKLSDYSFPSGHTMASFEFFTVVCFMPIKKIYKVLAGILAFESRFIITNNKTRNVFVYSASFIPLVYICIMGNKNTAIRV
jgi:hypothetical protein